MANPVIFKFKKGQAVPLWLQAVYVDDELTPDLLRFATRGKLAVLEDGNVVIWPSRRKFRCVMRGDPGRLVGSVRVHGGGVNGGSGNVHLFGVDGRHYSTTCLGEARLNGYHFSNRAKVDALPVEFDRYRTASSATFQQRTR